MTVPKAAVDAAAEAISRELMSGKDYSMAIDSDEALAQAALEAAAPLIAAAERDRIRQLAISAADRVDATGNWKDQPLALRWFADLLNGAP